MPSGVYKRTEKHKEQRRKIMTGQVFSETWRRNMSIAHTGVKRPSFTDEWRKNIGDARRGKKNPKHSDFMKGHNVSLETRKKHSIALRGDKGPNWQGGKTEKSQTIRGSLEYKLWRESVFKRDNYTCVWCGDKQKAGHKVVLNADHIKPFAYFPELRFIIENGRTLCKPCHKKTNTYGEGAKKFDT